MSDPRGKIAGFLKHIRAGMQSKRELLAEHIGRKGHDDIRTAAFQRTGEGVDPVPGTLDGSLNPGALFRAYLSGLRNALDTVIGATPARRATSPMLAVSSGALSSNRAVAAARGDRAGIRTTSS